MVGSLALVPRKAQCACQYGHMETVQISLQRGVIGSSGVSMMVDIHHYVLKSTTSAGVVALVYLVCFVYLVEQD